MAEVAYINEEDFQTKVVDIVRKHAPDLDEDLVNSRLSKGGKYRSITVPIQAQSQKQLDAIYQELTDDEQVFMLL